MAHTDQSEGGIVETLQSLIVAFVLAMTFRGFVAEGFVIPTGSMAPTLMGQHRLIHSDVTGYTFPIGLDQRESAGYSASIDPMLGPGYPVDGLRPVQEMPRQGDRILVLKTIYPFVQPKRWDVVVFKNPTDPKGEAGNYIKRLIGLPNETVWIVDGDIFVRENDSSPFTIQRKPEHVQRNMWQPVHHSDFAMVKSHSLRRAYPGPPWQGEGWDVSGRAYRSDTAEPTVLRWDSSVRRLDDWAMYNMLLGAGAIDRRPQQMPAGDVRIKAGVVPDHAGLETTLELRARGHLFEYSIGGGQARVRYRGLHNNQWIDQATAPIDGPMPGRVMNVDFWHVDQSMRLFINDREIVRLDYDWSPIERLENATGETDSDAVRAAWIGRLRDSEVQWKFSGSPVTLHRVQTDRDVYYRGGVLQDLGERENPTRPQYATLVENGSYGFGTHPDKLAVLGPDHFFMLGDNSQASLDSRVWKNPHPLVAEQIDDAPFVAHRKLLLGKAWVVYFPAMHALTPKGPAIVPDFGRLRYIR